ncbi:MAG TPA: hypothetical protein VFU89_02575 [Rhabdochlamydiaceae bacterium]|nr:hypothetical protein [Rhabdochlamydiaceae bacterium]
MATPLARARHAPNVYQGITTPQKILITVTALTTFVLHQIFRRSAYSHSCDHYLKNSFERTTCLKVHMEHHVY